MYFYMNILLYEYTLIWNVVLDECTAIWMYSYMNILLYECSPNWMYFYMNILLDECTSIWLYFCMIVLLYECTSICIWTNMYVCTYDCIWMRLNAFSRSVNERICIYLNALQPFWMPLHVPAFIGILFFNFILVIFSGFYLSSCLLGNIQIFFLETIWSQTMNA